MLRGMMYRHASSPKLMETACYEDSVRSAQKGINKGQGRLSVHSQQQAPCTFPGLQKRVALSPIADRPTAHSDTFWQTACHAHYIHT